MFVNGLSSGKESLIYSFMITKQRLTIPLIILSLLSMLAIQGYFLISDFQTNKESFQNDVNTSLELIVTDVQEDRLSRQDELHKRDLMDSTLIRIEYEPYEGSGTSISLINVGTDSKELSFKFSKGFDPDTMTKEAILDKIFRWNGKSTRKERVYYGIGQIIDARMSVYRDTLSANRKLVVSLLNKRFREFKIQSQYEVVYLQKDSAYQKQTAEFVTEFFEINDKGGSIKMGVIIPKPFWHIVGRSSGVITASVCAVILVLFSFWFMTSIIKDQKRLAETKDDFIDNITHELLTPISTLSVSLESLERYNAIDDKKKAKDYLKISKMELNRITGLVQNVLQVSLHNSSDSKLKMVDSELVSILKEVIDYYAIKSDSPVNFELLTNGEFWVNCDAYHLNNVLYNLVDNAIKYSKDQQAPRITFEIKQGEALTLEVTDNGIGIPYDEKEKVFDKFHRVSQNGLHKVKGMGIGLYYAKTIMKKMGGELSLKKSSDEGSVFTLTLMKGQESHV